MKRICCRCHIEKIISEFPKDCTKPSGYSYRCKKCATEAIKNAYHKKTKEERLKYYLNNKEKCLANGKKYRKKHYKERLKYFREYEKMKMKSDPSYRLRKYLGGRIKNALKAQHASKTNTLLELCGTGYNMVKEHLEKQFKPGMTWDNHGEWHIDHIIPISKFDLTNPEEVKKACHYTNLQPLWAKENIMKRDKI